jgi:glucokinase
LSETVYLVADIGATHARFQVCNIDNDGVPSLLGEPLILVTQDFTQVDALTAAVLERWQGQRFARALLAVAGPIDLHSGDVTVLNTGLLLPRQALEVGFNCPVVCVNDFYAQAFAVPHLSEYLTLNSKEQSHNRSVSVDQPLALLGPGSGLGMATLIPEPLRQWRVLASEGGHADLAPGSFLEAELWSILAQEHRHVCWETVLSGPGLVNLYRAISGIWGSKPEDLTPAEISSAGLQMADPVCHQTLETFAGLLGSAAANFALTVGARGGVYLGGGLVAKLSEFLLTSPLRRRFDERGDLSAYVKDISVHLITQPEPGLLGASHCLAHRVRQSSF